ncbi:MAG: PCP reductase family protein [Dehalococcoidales bacterium]|nr:PCP reductase family protein [Dehalococcoidales bacterium]
MRLEKTTEPEEGSISITFACPKCGNRIILLTNPGETQLVRALNVRIGGGPSTAEPMELVRGTLARQRDQAAFAPQAGAAQAKETVFWTDEAEKRLLNVPDFARSMARKAIEQFAMEEGYDKITPDVMGLAREKRGG